MLAAAPISWGWYVLEQDIMLDRVPPHAPEDVQRSVNFIRRHV
jgi:hypothetical protein